MGKSQEKLREMEGKWWIMKCWDNQSVSKNGKWVNYLENIKPEVKTVHVINLWKHKTLEKDANLCVNLGKFREN